MTDKYDPALVARFHSAICDSVNFKATHDPGDEDGLCTKKLRDLDAQGLRVVPADWMSPSGVMQDDMTALMEVLGIGTHARPVSPHTVMVDEVIPRARERIAELAAARAALVELERLFVGLGRQLDTTHDEIRLTRDAWQQVRGAIHEMPAIAAAREVTR
jgi:hypothetical protein